MYTYIYIYIYIYIGGPRPAAATPAAARLQTAASCDTIDYIINIL